MKDDLISRSALLEELQKGTIITDDLYGMGIMAGNDHAMKKIKEAPAVDAETVFQHLDLMQEAFDMAKSTLTPAPAWISVKDRLPETESRCLVVRYDGVTKTSFIDILWFDKGTWWNRIFGGEYAVTHWMPLPEPPKEG